MPHLRLAPLAAAFAALVAAPAGSQSREQRPVWNRAIPPFTVAGNVHYVGTAELGAYLITTPVGHVLIDGAMPESADIIAANVRSLGFRLEDVRHLLISHAHMDHAGGLQRLKQLTGARLHASAGDRVELETGKSPYRDDLWTSPPVKVDRLVRHGQRLAIGGTTLVAHLTPGHTRGCTSWSMKVRHGGALRDLLFACSLTVAGQPLVRDRRYPQAAADFRTSFARLKRMRADIFLTFHAGFFDLDAKRARLAAGDANAFVDPSELPRRVATAEAAFAAELARQEASQPARPQSP